jgi:hypothetical protein
MHSLADFLRLSNKVEVLLPLDVEQSMRFINSFKPSGGFDFPAEFDLTIQPYRFQLFSRQPRNYEAAIIGQIEPTNNPQITKVSAKV